MGINKRRRKAAESLKKAAATHLLKIKSLNDADNPVSAYWHKEAKNYAAQAKRREKQLPQSKQKTKREQYETQSRAGKRKKA